MNGEVLLVGPSSLCSCIGNTAAVGYHSTVVLMSYLSL